jgi:hypothetical protein
MSKRRRGPSSPMSIREPLEPVAERHVEMRACRFITAAAAFTNLW